MTALRTFFRQFPLIIALRVLIAEATRRLMTPGATVSYAESGEDRIIAALLRGHRPSEIRYVDIGCNQPFKRSNTAYFYSRGARGLVVDANRDCVAAFRRHRPRDHAVCACVGPDSGEVSFSIMPSDAVSSMGRHDGAKRVDSVPMRTGDSLLAEAAITSDFHLLTIDVEGAELDVLRSIDFDVFRPKIIVVEAHLRGEQISMLFDMPVCRYLGERGYELVAYAVLNAYFVRRAGSAL